MEARCRSLEGQENTSPKGQSTNTVGLAVGFPGPGAGPRTSQLTYCFSCHVFSFSYQVKSKNKYPLPHTKLLLGSEKSSFSDLAMDFKKLAVQSPHLLRVTPAFTYLLTPAAPDKTLPSPVPCWLRPLRFPAAPRWKITCFFVFWVFFF